MIKMDKTLFVVVIIVLLFLVGMAAIIFVSQHSLLEKALNSNVQLNQEIVILKWSLDDCEKDIIKDKDILQWYRERQKRMKAVKE